MIDTPVRAATRAAFDAPTRANLDALIRAVREEQVAVFWLMALLGAVVGFLATFLTTTRCLE